MLSPEFGQGSNGSTLIFGDTRMSLKHSVGQVEGNMYTKN